MPSGCPIKENEFTSFLADNEKLPLLELEISFPINLKKGEFVSLRPPTNSSAFSVVFNPNLIPLKIYP